VNIPLAFFQQKSLIFVSQKPKVFVTPVFSQKAVLNRRPRGFSINRSETAFLAHSRKKALRVTAASSTAKLWRHLL